MKNRRIGFIVVATKLLLDAIDDGTGANIFNGAVPLDMSGDFVSDTTKITMWHPDFEQVKDAQCVPEYVAVFHDGCVYPSFRRVAK